MFAELSRKSTGLSHMVAMQPQHGHSESGRINRAVGRLFCVPGGIVMSLDCLVKDRSCFTIFALTMTGFRLPPPPTVDANIPFKRVNLFQGTRCRGGGGWSVIVKNFTVNIFGERSCGLWVENSETGSKCCKMEK